MKIIFDSEEEKRQCLQHRCPSDFKYGESEKCEYEIGEGGFSCDDCWRECSIEMEVRNDSN